MQADETGRMCSWLIGLMCLLFVWISVTIITDWRSTFYRKAIRYRRELEKRVAQRDALQRSIISTSSYRSLSEGSSSRNRYNKTKAHQEDASRLVDVAMNDSPTHEAKNPHASLTEHWDISMMKAVQ